MNKLIYMYTLLSNCIQVNEMRCRYINFINACGYKNNLVKTPKCKILYLELQLLFDMHCHSIHSFVKTLFFQRTYTNTSITKHT